MSARRRARPLAPPPPSSDARRTVPEAVLLEETLYNAWYYEVRAGQKAEALAKIRQILARWRELGLPCRVDGDERFYDGIEVSNFNRWFAQRGEDETWIERNGESSRRQAGGPAELDPRRLSGLDDPRRVEFVMTYRYAGSHPLPTSVVLPLPYEDPTQLEASFAIDRLAGFLPEIETRPGRLYLRPDPAAGAAERVAEVRVRMTSSRCGFDLAACGDLASAAAAGAAHRRFLRDREVGVVVVTDRVRALAREIAGDARTVAELVDRMRRFFYERMRCGWIYHDQLSPSDPLGSLLDLGWYDCNAGSSLWVAIARCLGIAARVVGGYGFVSTAATLHYWAEMYLPPHGWVPFDISLGWHLAAGVLDDRAWSEWGFAQLDHRLKIHVYPTVLSPLMGVTWPADHSLTERLDDDGAVFTAAGSRPPRELGALHIGAWREAGPGALAHPIAPPPA